jgi:putative hydrolase of the HAD superfamily
MIHVGDHPVDDIQGAAELGIHTLWINHTREPFNGVIAPSAEVHSFRDLQAGVETIATLNH